MGEWHSFSDRILRNRAGRISFSAWRFLAICCRLTGILAGIAARPHFLFVGLTLAGILGDSVNYWVGKKFGITIFTSGKFRFLKQEHLDKTHAFYLKYGGKTIIIARFIPIIRTFAPFVAGIGTMPYRKFIAYNVIGAVLWVAYSFMPDFISGNCR